MSSEYEVPEAKCRPCRHDVSDYSQDEPDAHAGPSCMAGHLFQNSTAVFDMFDKPFDMFDKPFDAFDKLFDAFDKPFDAFDKPFDAFDKSFDTFDKTI